MATFAHRRIVHFTEQIVVTQRLLTKVHGSKKLFKNVTILSQICKFINNLFTLIMNYEILYGLNINFLML